MKKIAGLIYITSFCAGTVWVEYEAISRFGVAFILIAGASALGALSAAVHRAPQGQESVDGFRIRPRHRRPSRTRLRGIVARHETF
jgi:hypothetical protein